MGVEGGAELPNRAWTYEPPCWTPPLGEGEKHSWKREIILKLIKREYHKGITFTTLELKVPKIIFSVPLARKGSIHNRFYNLLEGM